MAVANVVAKFTADTGDFRQQMSAAEKSFGAVSDAATFSSARIREVGESMARAGAKMTVGLTLPLGGIAVAAGNAAMSFEASMNKIVGLVGIASAEVADMGDEVLQMAGNVGKAPDELADALFVVTSAGLRGSEAMSTLSSAARAGAAGLGETNDIARAVSGALSAYGSEVLSASEATDAIVATARAGNFETSQFAAAVGRVLPFAQQAGASLQDMGGAVALLTRVNGNASESVTQMLALFRAFVVPTEEAKKALDDVGMSAGDLRASIAEKGLPATLRTLEAALGGNREQLGRLLGSSEAASAAFQILNADTQTINDTFGVVANSAGMTAEAFGAVSGTAQFQMNQAMAELRATLVDLGQQFLPIIKSIADFVQAHLSGFNSLPGPVKTMITVMGAFLAALGPILFIVGKIIVVFSTLLSLMMKTRAVGAMRAAFSGLRGDMAATRASIKSTQTSFGMLGTAANLAKVGIVTSFKAIGAAAKGLLASLGPIGLALLGIGAAFEIFMGKAAATEHHLANLRDEIDLTTGAMSEAGRTFIASELRHNISQEDLDMMEEYGVTISGFIAALEQGGPALDDYRAKIQAMGEAEKKTGGVLGTGVFNIGTVDSMNTIIETLDGMIEQYDNAKKVAGDTAKAQNDAATSAGAAAYQHLQAAIASGNVASAYPIASQAADEYGDAAMKAAEEQQKLNETFDVFLGGLSEIGAVDRARESIGALGESAVENGTKLMGAGKDAEAFRSDVIRAFEDSAQKATILGKTAEEQREIFTGELVQIVAALRASGVKDSDIEMFLGAMNDLPASVTDIMQMAVTAVGETDYTSALEKSFDRSVKAGAPMTADAMERMAEGASQKAKERLGLTLEPELKAIIETAGRNLATPATEAGRGTGANISNGMAAGITGRSYVVQQAVARVVAEAKAAADRAAESRSPSRLFAESGDDMMNGVAMGITRSTRKVTKAAEKSVKTLNKQYMNRVQKMFEEIGKAIDKGMKDATEAAAERLEAFRERMSVLGDALSEWRAFVNGVRQNTPTLEQSLNRVDRLFGRLKKSADVKNVTDRSVASFRRLASSIQNELQNALSIAQDNLAQMEDAFNDLQSTVSDAIRNVVSFSDAEEIGAELGVGFLEGLRRQVENAAAFAAIIDELRRQGLSESALREIINAGAEAGTKIGSELISGGAEAISEANELIEQVESIADTIGTETAQAFYGAGVESARQQVRGILDQIDRMTPRIMRMMDRLARRMARTAVINVELSQSDFTVRLNVEPTIHEVTAQGATFQGVAMAAGGIVERPTIALVGEAGPEAVVPLSQAGRYGLGESKSFTIENLVINPAPGERAEETVPRALRRLAFSMGFDD